MKCMSALSENFPNPTTTTKRPSTQLKQAYLRMLCLFSMYPNEKQETLCYPKEKKNLQLLHNLDPCFISHVHLSLISRVLPVGSVLELLRFSSTPIASSSVFKRLATSSLLYVFALKLLNNRKALCRLVLLRMPNERLRCTSETKGAREGAQEGIV